MATRKGTIQLAHGDLAVTARFETERLEPDEIEDAPEIARWDAEKDQPVIRQRYVKPEHGEIEGEPALPSGTVGYRYVNEDGDEVPSERLVYVRRTEDGGIERVDKRPSTVRKDAVLPVEKWIPLDDVGDFLIESTYELWGQAAEDEAELQALAEWIDEEGEAPMFVWMLQPEFFKSWGILVPEFNEDRSAFSLLVKVTRNTLEPTHEMPVLTAAEAQEIREAAEEHFVEQEVPG